MLWDPKFAKFSVGEYAYHVTRKNGMIAPCSNANYVKIVEYRWNPCEGDEYRIITSDKSHGVWVGDGDLMPEHELLSTYGGNATEINVFHGIYHNVHFKKVFPSHKCPGVEEGDVCLVLLYAPQIQFYYCYFGDGIWRYLHEEDISNLYHFTGSALVV